MLWVQEGWYEASSHWGPTILEWPINLSLALCCSVCVCEHTFLYLREKETTILRPKKLDATKQNLVALAPRICAPLWGTWHLLISWANVLWICEMVTDMLFSTCECGISWAVNYQLKTVKYFNLQDPGRPLQVHIYYYRWNHC